MRNTFDLQGVTRTVALTRQGDAAVLYIGEARHDVSIRDLGAGEKMVTVDGAQHRIWIAAKGDRVFLHARGRAWEVAIQDPLTATGRGRAHADHVIAPMPGTVVSQAAQPGDAVAAGAEILTIESMKLETTIKAPRDAVVESLPLPPGATFEKGATLVTLAPPKGETEEG